MIITDGIRRPLVVVLGAGVIGLQTALRLVQQGLDVAIISKDWPGDKEAHYTSMWSGAQWQSNPDMEDLRQQDWDRQTFVRFAELVKKVPPEELGIELKPARFYWLDHATPEALSPEKFMWWTTFIPSFQVLPPSALSIDGKFAAGISYETFAISPFLYLQYLFSSCTALGVKMRTFHVQTIPEVFSIPGMESAIGVVNCSGLGAGKLVPDPACFPTKGQTVIVKGQANHIATRAGDGWEAIVIPRPGADKMLLGGCKISGDWSTDADDEMTKTILNRCCSIAPELLDADGQFEVLAVQVGLRPSRKGGPRVEVEMLEEHGKGGVKESPKFVVHNYGDHSAGFEGSVGAANAAVSLVLQCIKDGS